jgi:ribosomal protein S18 acetylase RimI-like enzyme
MKTVSFRPIADTDLEFLQRLYASTRAEELALAPWSDAEKDRFCRMQFHAQHTHYQNYFSGASYDVIEQEGAAVGRLYVDRDAGEIRILDITIAPECRGAGLGTEILQALLEEAQAGGKRVVIHVEKFNRALRLYERLGFSRVEDTGVYWQMEWRAPS